MPLEICLLRTISDIDGVIRLLDFYETPETLVLIFVKIQQSTYALEKTSNLDFKQASDNEVCKGVYICIHTIFHFILQQICTYLL